MRTHTTTMIEPSNLMRGLDTLPCGQAARIVSLDARQSISQRLAMLGLIPGALVKVVQVAPLGDPITVELSSSRISVRRKDVAALGVVIES